MPKVFISFDYEDLSSKKTVDNWKNQNIGGDISFSSEDGHSYSDRGDDFVKRLLREKIAEAQVVLVLVGNNTHNRFWVDYEVHQAKTQGKKVIWTQIPKTNGAPPKEIIKTLPVLFDINHLRQALRKP